MTATVGAWAGPAQPGTAYVLLHLSMGDSGDGHVGGWGFARGGMGGFAAACRRAAEANGAEVMTGAPVARIDVAGDAVRGVTLADGREIHAPIVVSTVHPKVAFLAARRPRPAAGRVRRRRRALQVPRRRREDQPRARRAAAVRRGAVQPHRGASHGEHRDGRVAGLRPGGVRRRRRRPPRRAPDRRRDDPVHARRHAHAARYALPVALHPVGAPRVGVGAPPRRARGVRRPRRRRLRRAVAEPQGVHPGPSGDRALRHGA